MGLYDNYRAVNSNRIAEFQGSAVPELMQASQIAQQRYDKAQDGMDWASNFLGSLKAAPKDQEQLKTISAKFRDRIAALSKRPDLENALREVTMMGRELPQEYAPFAARIQQRQQYREDLDKRVASGKLTEDRQRALMAMSDYMDRGVEIDPNTGRYTGSYNGIQGSDDYNWAENTDKWFKGAKPMVNGVQHEWVDGQWIRSSDHKVVSMPKERIDAIVAEGIANDPHAQADLRLQQQLGSYNLDYSKVDPASLKLSPDMQDLLQKGHSLTSIMQGKAKVDIFKKVVGDAMNYARQKYYQHDVTVGDGMKENGYARDEAAHKLTEESNRFMLSGPDTTFGETKEQSGKELAESVKNLQTSIDEKLKALKSPTLAPDERAKLEKDVSLLTDQKTAKESVRKTVEDVVARRLGYKDKEDFDKKNSFTDRSSASPVERAYLNTAGKAETTAAKGGVRAIPLSEMSRFTAAFDKEMKENGKSYAFKPMNIGFSEQEAKSLKKQIEGNMAGVQWFKAGDLSNPLKDKHVADIGDFDISSMQVVQKDGSFYIQADGRSTEKGKVGQRTGQNYNIKIPAGSNVGKIVSRNILANMKGNYTQSPELVHTAAVLSGEFQFSGDIAKLAKGETYTVRDKNNNIFTTIKRDPYETGGSRYRLYNSAGQPIPGYESENLADIDKWVSESIMKHMKQ